MYRPLVTMCTAQDSELAIHVFEMSPAVDFTENMCLHMSDMNPGPEVTEVGRLAVSVSVRAVSQ